MKQKEQLPLESSINLAFNIQNRYFTSIKQALSLLSDVATNQLE